MGGAKSPSALAPFAHDWIGGDIHGLSAYAGTLYGYVPRLSDVATALDTQGQPHRRRRGLERIGRVGLHQGLAARRDRRNRSRRHGLRGR